MLTRNDRVLLYLVVAYVAFAELLSLETSTWPLCVVDASKYGAYYSEHNECPALHAFFIKSLADILKAVGHQWLIAVATAILAIFTIVLARVGGRQIEDTRILQRAYLNVEPVGIEPWVPFGSDKTSGNEMVVCHCGIHNWGNLPARDVRWYINMTFCSRDDLKNDDFPIGNYVGEGVVIPPGVIIRQGGPHKTIINESFVYVWGQVTYHDGFAPGRFTKFCHRYNCRRFEIDEETGQRRIDPKYGRYHEYGNRTDESKN